MQERFSNLLFDERFWDEDVNESGSCNIEFFNDVIGRNFCDDFYRDIARICFHAFALKK